MLTGDVMATNTAQSSAWQSVLNGLLGTPQGNGLLSDDEKRAAQQQGLLALGAQMLQASGPSPVKTSLGQALGQGLLSGQQAQQQSLQQALQAQLLQSQINRNEARQAGTTPAAVQEYEYAKTNGYKGSFDEWKRIAAAQPQAPAALQEWEAFSKMNQEQQAQYLNMKRSNQPYTMIETADGKALLNRTTGGQKPLTTRDQEADAAGKMAEAEAGGKITGGAAATAQIDLPRLEQNAQRALQTIGYLKKSPGLPYITGAYSAAPIVPGTAQADADALAKQIQGKTFLEAYSTLKGGGQITEVEGAKAEAAIGRLQRSQTRREYIRALNDLEEVLNTGMDRARKAAGGNAQPRSREEILNQYGIAP